MSVQTSFGQGTAFECNIVDTLRYAGYDVIHDKSLVSDYLTAKSKDKTPKHTQIDMMVVSDKVYVLEVKSSKVIYGNYDEQSWQYGSTEAAMRTRTSAYLQNLMHIQALRKLLKDTEWKDIEIVSLIVVPDCSHIKSNVTEFCEVSDCKFRIGEPKKNPELYQYLLNNLSEIKEVL